MHNKFIFLSILIKLDKTKDQKGYKYLNKRSKNNDQDQREKFWAKRQVNTKNEPAETQGKETQYIERHTWGSGENNQADKG